MATRNRTTAFMILIWGLCCLLFSMLGCVAKCPECSKDLVEIPIRYGLPIRAGECERRGEALEGGCVLFLDMNVAEACLECRKYRIPAAGGEAIRWYRLPLHFGVEKVVED